LVPLAVVHLTALKGFSVETQEKKEEKEILELVPLAVGHLST